MLVKEHQGIGIRRGSFLASYRFKVIIAGDECVGKTACIRRFVDSKFSESYKQTLGFEVSIKVITINQNPVILSIFDVAGQKSYQKIRANYYTGANGYCLLFDQTNYNTFNHLEEWFREIRAVSPSSPILLIGNKNDVPQKQVTSEDVSLALKKYGIPAFIKTSAKTGEGIQEMFLQIGNIMIGR